MEIDCTLVSRRDRKNTKDVDNFGRVLLVIDLAIDRSIKKKVRSYRFVKRRVWKLEEVEYRRFFERFYDLVNMNDQNIWNSFRSGVLKLVTKCAV